MPRRRVLLAGSAAAAIARGVQAADRYPAQPIRIIVPFEAGGGGDLIVRLIAEQLSQRMGEPVVVEDRAGASGTVGTEFVAHARPDGYTLLMSNVAPMAINASLYRHLPYDPVKDFTAIVPFAVFPNVLVTSPQLKVRSVQALVRLAKTRPQGLNYASAGPGSITNLSAEMFRHATGLKMVQVAYRGGGPALAALAGNQIDLYFSSLPAALPYVKEGRLVALGVTSAQRADAAPDIPTIAESGIPDFEAVTWIGLVGPAGLPPDIVGRLNEAVTDILREPPMREKLLRLGAQPSFATPSDYAAYIRKEVARWHGVVEKAHITLQ